MTNYTVPATFQRAHAKFSLAQAVSLNFMNAFLGLKPNSFHQFRDAKGNMVGNYYETVADQRWQQTESEGDKESFADTEIDAASSHLKPDGEAIDAKSTPFEILPLPAGKVALDSYKAGLGDVVYVYNTLTQKGYFAVYANLGPRGTIGQGGTYLISKIGGTANTNAGTDSGIIHIAFPASKDDHATTDATIQAAGAKHMATFLAAIAA